MTDRPHPDGLAAAGATLWIAVTAVLDLDEHEALALRELCRTADVLDELQAVVDRDGVLLESSQGMRAHPALTELRQQRIAFARLVAAMRLPSGLAAAAKRLAAGEPPSPETKPVAEAVGADQRRQGARGVYSIGAAS